MHPLLTLHSSDDLVCHVPDLFNGKRLKVVFLEEIIGAEAEQLKGNTYVAVVIKPVQDLHTSTLEKKKVLHKQSLAYCAANFLCELQGERVFVV